MRHLTAVKVLALLVNGAFAITISEIQGIAFQSPLAGQFVHGLTGVVTAKVPKFREFFRTLLRLIDFARTNTAYGFRMSVLKIPELPMASGSTVQTSSPQTLETSSPYLDEWQSTAGV